MTRLLIAYHSTTGGTRQMVEAAVAAGREAADIEIVVRQAAEASPDDLLSADGYLFATPENLAAIAGVMKAFFDATYYPLLGKIEGRPYAALICAGSDGTNARVQLERICTGWRLKRIADTPIVCTHAQTKEEILADKTIPEEDLDRCREIGATLAAGLEMGIF
ncbi:MAG: flavodoxin family protein [Parasphingopyxis sp.]|nr:flavodoxin family protein [Sphingomonadales bacterium]